MSSLLKLVVYHSPLFAAHWALFLPTHTNSKIGKRIHADGSPASGFEVLFESEYDIRECTQSYEVIELGVVEDADLERIARSVNAPGKSLISVSGTGPRRRIEVKNCQTWLTEVVRRMVDSGVIQNEALRHIEDAPKN
ncbi:hypothetical protein K505DRAFT_285057 [Melanomma pulvis-pyrius CBS 109.77]|uniref:Uncharacterized protein n=1 Tax=Melanomma pulvis-pyrius CBS 109.77 TaxID=1314802 RepID=A0A6A6WZE5_9PLEO|nr:hypothetical protein K505DRAFT_285057 [Melanomma pulvis-pyrius CBS 109.77]